MIIRATIENRAGDNRVTLATNGNARALDIPPKATGPGSSANGGELLFLALATCYCNDIYREAALRGIQVEQVEVEVEGEFGGPGDPARHVRYRARVTANASEADILDLMRHTDTVAEIQNTLRQSSTVELSTIEAVSVET